MTALREIVRTCTNVHIARAALRRSAAISPSDSPLTLRAATCRAACSLRGWCVPSRIHAADDERRSVEAVTHGADQPVLAGLRHILARGLAAGRIAAADAAEDMPPAWAICAARNGGWSE